MALCNWFWDGDVVMLDGYNNCKTKIIVRLPFSMEKMSQKCRRYERIVLAWYCRDFLETAPMFARKILCPYLLLERVCVKRSDRLAFNYPLVHSDRCNNVYECIFTIKKWLTLKRTPVQWRTSRTAEFIWNTVVVLLWLEWFWLWYEIVNCALKQKAVAPNVLECEN